ncbi:hypothetical protein FO519_009520 [Halicephalobus sp. NKZ332]|nr:hypothetical protein FO519_009520 [Halicephalobus sp. NKZ332]
MSANSAPDEGLSSTPDSFAEAGVPVSDTETTPMENDSEWNNESPKENMEVISDEESPQRLSRNTGDGDGPTERYSENVDDEDVKELLFDDFTEEMKAKMDPRELQKIEERTQNYYISMLPKYFPGLRGCRSVAEYNCLNKIDEGTFGIVYRAQEKRTGEICALKRLKLERERDGFPITSLREVNLLLMCRDHPNVVNVKEIVVGQQMDKIYLVMEYVEHDLKALIDQLKERGKKFTTGQIKTLSHQLLSGLSFMHDNWMIHRDLKTSNLLLSHKGILKIGDFGLARTYGQPLKPYTPVVVTLWYRCPELLLGVKEYSVSVDMWSTGCIMAELFKLKPLFMGRGELDQLDKIFHQLGTPTSRTWPGFENLPLANKITFKQYPYNQLRKQFGSDVISENGLALLNGLLVYDPNNRLTADQALKSPWFEERPLPTPPEQFPTWPAKSEKGKIPPQSQAPPPEPSSPQMPELDDHTKELYKQLNIDPAKEKPGFSDQGESKLKRVSEISENPEDFTEVAPREDTKENRSIPVITTEGDHDTSEAHGVKSDVQQGDDEKSDDDQEDKKSEVHEEEHEKKDLNHGDEKLSLDQLEDNKNENHLQPLQEPRVQKLSILSLKKKIRI